MIGRILRSALKLFLAVVLFVVALEVILHYWPGLLSPRLANHAFAKYGSFPGGIYFFDAESGIHFMRSDFETEAYFNGYRWTHSTDHRGFRNPSLPASGSVFLLGDSMIYGHGVEERETAAHALRANHGVEAYNMGRQGDTLYQSYVLTRLNVDALQPSVVIVFVFLNDFHDLGIYRSDEEMQGRPEAGWDYPSLQARLDELEVQRSLHPRLLLGLASVRLLRGVWREMIPLGVIATAQAAEPGGDEPPYLDTLLDPATFSRAAAYYEATLVDMRDRLAERGTQLLVVDLSIGVDLGEKGHRAQQRLSSFLAGACERLDLSCASTAELFDGCAGCFLPGDGHLSAAGHALLANWLAQVLPLPSPIRP